jgi:hypothetical protein
LIFHNKMDSSLRYASFRMTGLAAGYFSVYCCQSHNIDTISITIFMP